MGDVRDWARFIRSRWDWTDFGYERGFPRGCQFTDVDAGTEFNSKDLLIETKLWDGLGAVPTVRTGQLLYLRREAATHHKTVLILYGCGVCNNPLVVDDVATGSRYDWRDKSLIERRQLFKDLIDVSMGLEITSLSSVKRESDE
jgi:hypothetical protein